MRSAVSKGKSTQNVSFIPNKYFLLVEKNFPDSYDPNKESEDKLGKSNDRIRGMIKKLNEELQAWKAEASVTIGKLQAEIAVRADMMNRLLEEKKKAPENC